MNVNLASDCQMGGRYQAGGCPCAGENVAVQRWVRIPCWKRIGGHKKYSPGSIFSGNVTRISRVTRINKYGMSASQTNRGDSEASSPMFPFVGAWRFLSRFLNFFPRLSLTRTWSKRTGYGDTPDSVLPISRYNLSNDAWILIGANKKA